MERPRVLPALPKGPTPMTEGYAQIARILGAALGDNAPVSTRTQLFRPLPAEPMAWLLATLPTYFQNTAGEAIPLAPHHEELWDYLWALRPGVPARTMISILARGGGKSTTTELGAAVIGYFGLRRYGLYICNTQTQANDHLANVGSVLERLGVERAINRYGFSRGWNITRLRTADNFTMDAVGMDTAIRGVRIDEARPDLLILDDLDEQLDTLDTIDKKIDILTRKILPTGAAALAVMGVQNLPNKDGIFAQLADGRAQFLMDRHVSGPYPALLDLPEQDWYTQEPTPQGPPRFRLPGGRPVWVGQNHADCEALLNLIGPRAFEIECLHRVQRLEGLIFKREWFQVVDDWPRQAQLVRYWDFAATEEPKAGQRAAKDPDWTVGLLLALWQGQFWVVDLQRDRLSPLGVETLVAQTARLDGRGVDIWLEEEGGSSGKSVSATYRQRVLLGYSVHTWHTTGSKMERAKPVSAAAEAGNVFLVRAAWNAAFLDEVCFVAGTLITTAHGDIPIEQVQPGERVLTRYGWKEVYKAELTGDKKETILLQAGSHHLTGTPTHPIWIEGKGWVPLGHVQPGDHLLCLQSTSLLSPPHAKRCAIVGCRSIGIPTRSVARDGTIFWDSGRAPLLSCTVLSIARKWALFLRACTSIIRMTIRAIMSQVISCYFPMKHIIVGISSRIPNVHTSVGAVVSPLCPGHVARFGIVQSAVAMPLALALAKYERRSAHSVRHLLPRQNYGARFVASLVQNWRCGRQPWPTENLETASASSVERSFFVKAVSPPVVRAIAVTSLAIDAVRQPVYNLQVKDCPEYFANGLLVHNCKFGLPGVHDDITDALSGAHYGLTLGKTLLPSDFSLAPALDRMALPNVELRAQTAALMPAMAHLWGDTSWDEDVL